MKDFWGELGGTPKKFPKPYAIRVCEGFLGELLNFSIY
jgi:hypothetical protein